MLGTLYWAEKLHQWRRSDGFDKTDRADRADSIDRNLYSSSPTHSSVPSTPEQRPSISLPRRENERRKSITLESVMTEFHLSKNTLRRMMDDMNKAMDKGLEGGLAKSNIAMLPSFVPHLPDGTERGKYVAMDLGGTNLRVMLMEIVPDETPTATQFNTRIPNWAMHGTAVQLFDFIAKCMTEFLEEKGVAQDGLKVGFTFSYPCEQTSLRSAKLLRWTKGFDASGVEGEDVVRLLEEAIQRHGGIKVEVVALINDTVGTMVAAAHEAKGVCHLGVIIATGTNASYMEHSKKISYGLANASEPYPYDKMIIDTEWGGFGDKGEGEYLKTQYDRIIDARSEHPGVMA
uniref:Phosphotransferase n=1 Tax=Plectus sambesii TaxID=2011161 RepID=A0A914WV58_9BILA